MGLMDHVYSPSPSHLLKKYFLWCHREKLVMCDLYPAQRSKGKGQQNSLRCISKGKFKNISPMPMSAIQACSPNKSVRASVDGNGKDGPRGLYSDQILM
jgi:hypothetical protein